MRKPLLAFLLAGTAALLLPASPASADSPDALYCITHEETTVFGYRVGQYRVCVPIP